MSGFITIERKLWDHPLFTPAPMTEREAWMWMIAQAAWAETRHRVGKELVTVPRGSFMATLREMQSVFMWGSDKRVRTFLKTLEKEGMIGRTTLGAKNAPKTHVTICNYDEYQTIGRTKDAPKTQDRTHHGRTTDAVKNHTNHINQEEDTNVSMPSAPKKPRPKSTRISEDARISDNQIKAAIKRGHSMQEAEAQFDKFKNHAISKGKTFVDWDRGFVTWLDSPYFSPASPQFKAINGGHNGQPASKSQQRMDAFIAGATGS